MSKVLLNLKVCLDKPYLQQWLLVTRSGMLLMLSLVTEFLITTGDLQKGLHQQPPTIATNSAHKQLKIGILCSQA
jgi:hypothetical protein